MSDLLTPSKAASSLGISVDQLAKLTDQGKLPYVDVGLGEKRPARRYEPDDIAAFKAARRKTECPSTNAPAPKRTRTTSALKVIDFQATLAELRSAKQKP